MRHPVVPQTLPSKWPLIYHKNNISVLYFVCFSCLTFKTLVLDGKNGKMLVQEETSWNSPKFGDITIQIVPNLVIYCKFVIDYEISLFRDKFYSRWAVDQKPQKGGGKSIYCLKALLITNSKINVSKLCLCRYLKDSAPKSRTLRCFMNSLKMNVFFHLSVGWLKCCLWGYQTSTTDFCGQIFYSLMVEELFLLNQECQFLMFNWRQLVNHGIY